METRSQTILALAPGTRHLGVSIWQNGELIFFGVHSLPGGNNGKKLFKEVVAYLTRTIASHDIDVLAIEEVEYSQARSSAPLLALVAGLKLFAKKYGLCLKGIRPSQVKERLCGKKATRRALAERIASEYRYLEPYLSKSRSKDYWQQMFDAVALGRVVAFGAKSPTESHQANRLGGLGAVWL